MSTQLPASQPRCFCASAMIDDTVSTPPARIPYWRIVYSQTGITDAVLSYRYPGSGTKEDPYVVTWIPNDQRNPFNFSSFTKWFITVTTALATLALTLMSSAYSGCLQGIMAEFDASSEVATLGVSLFVLGFAVGPLLWAPLSEAFGRQLIFVTTYGALTAFNAGTAGVNNMWSLALLRFFAGAFGASSSTNSGAVIADIFPAAQRGLGMTLFAVAPFLGPVLGPIIGGFLGQAAGWRWVMGFLAIFSSFSWIVGTLTVPETYTPVLLRRRAARLSTITGKHYMSKIDLDGGGRIALSRSLKQTLSRPWLLLFMEPIVLLLSIYLAIINGTLYMLFAAFPIVYGTERGWSQGIVGLSLLGVALRTVFGATYNVWDNRRYAKIVGESGFAPPEARLPPALVGSVVLPVGLFWFAWTNFPSVHWMVSIAAGSLFGFSTVLLYISVLNYLVDVYTTYAASALAANTVLRSLFGAAFPLFTWRMYDKLGIHWASSIPAFLSLACAPFPLLFYKYGPYIRSKCRFTAEPLDFGKDVPLEQHENKEAGDTSGGVTEGESRESENTEHMLATGAGG